MSDDGVKYYMSTCICEAGDKFIPKNHITTQVLVIFKKWITHECTIKTTNSIVLICASTEM